MWYPNKRQWWVIWISAILVILLMLLRVPGLYLSDAAIYYGIIIIIIGSLLVWQFSDRR